jgi:2-C-methyl-D-erythritol 4-phosphate cytidylyltransferase
MNDVQRAPQLHALVPCAGTGSRINEAQPKQYLPLAGKPLVRWTVEALLKVPELARVCVVVAAADTQAQLVLSGLPVDVARCGGATRGQSVRNGLHWLAEQGAHTSDWVLVHDAARCGITAGLVQRLIRQCVEDDVGGLLALPLPDTLKREQEGRSCGTMVRAGHWLAQTPQMFRLGALAAALDKAEDAGHTVTDEASAMELAGCSPRLVPGSMRNFKVTYADDLALAEAMLRNDLRND